MVKLRKGDRIMIANVDEIVFGSDHFVNGDIATVVQEGDDFIAVTVPPHTVDEFTDYLGDEPVFLIMDFECEHVIKLLPPNKGGER